MEEYYKETLPKFLEEMPSYFKDYITDPLCQEVEVKAVEMPEHISHITKQQAQEDFEAFRYVVDVAYAAKERWAICGVDFEEHYARIQKLIDSFEAMVPVNDLFNAYCRIFEKGDCDGHLSLTLGSDKRRFKRIYRAYFIDGILCEKRGEDYVSLTAAQGIVPGDVISGCNFYPTLAPEGKGYFLPGDRFGEPQACIEARINGEAKILKVHVIRIKPDLRGSYIYRHSVEEGVDVVDCPTCFDTSDKNYVLADELLALGKTLRDKPMVIWHAASNRGGENEYPERFILGLNDYSNLEIHQALLFSPLLDPDKEFHSGGNVYPEKNQRCWKFYPYTVTDPSLGKYEGKLIITMDNNNASSGEGVIAYGRSVKNCIIIGENSMGCSNFGGVPDYKLPHTGVNLHMANGIMSGVSDELMGITPTYWVDAERILPEVLRWIREGKDYFPRV